MQSAVYLSDGETWDTVEGCELVFYDNEEWGDGPKRSSKKSMDLQAVVDQAIVSRAAVRRLASALAGWSYAIESAAAWRQLEEREHEAACCDNGNVMEMQGMERRSRRAVNKLLLPGCEQTSLPGSNPSLNPFRSE